MHVICLVHRRLPWLNWLCSHFINMVLQVAGQPSSQCPQAVAVPTVESFGVAMLLLLLLLCFVSKRSCCTGRQQTMPPRNTPICMRCDHACIALSLPLGYDNVCQSSGDSASELCFLTPYGESVEFQCLPVHTVCTWRCPQCQRASSSSSNYHIKP
jgi:hypothetical protein